MIVSVAFLLLLTTAFGYIQVDGKECDNNNMNNSNTFGVPFSPKSYDFGNKIAGELDRAIFHIWGSDCCAITYILYEDSSWIDVSPISGSANNEPDIITVNIDTTDLDLGTHTCNIEIVSNFGNDTFTVTVNILKENSVELEISNIRGGIGKVLIDIKNTGDTVAEDLTSTISVTGGLFNKIDIYHECSGCSDCGTTLDPGAIKTESTGESGFIFGLGRVDVFVSVSATNAGEVTQTLNGIVIGALVIMIE